jgi:hypothetical protein
MRNATTARDDLKMSDPTDAVLLSLHEVQGTQILTHFEESDDDGRQWVVSLYPWAAAQVPR